MDNTITNTAAISPVEEAVVQNTNKQGLGLKYNPKLLRKTAEAQKAAEMLPWEVGMSVYAHPAYKKLKATLAVAHIWPVKRPVILEDGVAKAGTVIFNTEATLKWWLKEDGTPAFQLDPSIAEAYVRVIREIATIRELDSAREQKRLRLERRAKREAERLATENSIKNNLGADVLSALDALGVQLS